MNPRSTSCLDGASSSRNSPWRGVFFLASLFAVAPCLHADEELAIQTMLTDLSARIVAHDVAGAISHYSTEYMHGGEGYEGLSADLEENIPNVASFNFTITQISVGDGFATVSGLVEGTFDDGEVFTWEEPDRDDAGIGFGWLKKENGVWRVYGNQSRVGWYRVMTSNNLTHESATLRIAVESPWEIESVTVSGPYISPTSLGPDGVYGGFSGFAIPSQRPPSGSEYTIDIVYVGGHAERVTDSIQAWIETAPELTVSTINGTTTFSWNDVTAEVPNTARYMLSVSGNGVEWHLGEIPIDQTFVEFNADGSAIGSLEPGYTYTAILTVQNETHDYAYKLHVFSVVESVDKDSDGDGLSDFEEYMWGTEPDNPASRFEVSYSRSMDGFSLSWVSVAGRLYDVQWSPDLTSEFQTLVQGIEYPGNSYTDTARNGDSSGFYRIAVRLKP